MTKYLADTTILVDHLRGVDKAKAFLLNESPSISHITVAELIKGAKNKQELQAVEQAVGDLAALPIEQSISSGALDLLKTYFLSHGLQFLDALIATTAIERNLTLVTANVKDFSFLKGLALLDWKKVEVEIE